MKTSVAFVSMFVLAGCAAEYETSYYRPGSRKGKPNYTDDDAVTSTDQDAVLAKTPLPEGGAAVDTAGSPPPPITAFTGAGPYAPSAPRTQSARHDGYKTNAGFDCMSCHDGKSETSGIPRFIFAGTVYAAQGSTTGARNVEVRLVDSTGQQLAMVGTDDAGNFWLKASALTQLPAGTRVGVRNGVSTKVMGAPIGDGTISAGACNRSGCHTASRRIHL